MYRRNKKPWGRKVYKEVVGDPASDISKDEKLPTAF